MFRAVLLAATRRFQQTSPCNSTSCWNLLQTVGGLEEIGVQVEPPARPPAPPSHAVQYCTSTTRSYFEANSATSFPENLNLKGRAVSIQPATRMGFMIALLVLILQPG